MKKITYVTVILSAFIPIKAYSQPAFSLVDVSKMILDPAFTGMDTAFKNTISIYSELSTSNTVPLTVSINTIGTYQMSLDKINSGVGIMFNYNNYDYNSQVAAKLYYRYTILPGLSIGADAGLVNLKANYQLGGLMPLGIGPFYPVYNNDINENNLDFDGGLGILYQFKSVYAGFAVDHITSPEATYPEYDNPELEIESAKIPMMNYTGIAYNWIVGGFIGGPKGGLEISAFYRNFVLNINTSMVLPHFFIGFSVLAENNNYYLPESLDGTDAYFALMAGIKACRNKIKISFAYNYSGDGTLLPSALESEVSYSF